MNSTSESQPIPLNASSRILYQEALALGIKCDLLGDRETILMSYQGKNWMTRGSRTSVQSSVGRSIADNKTLTKKVLEYFKLPTAKYVRVNKTEELESIKQLNFPLVMKPIDQSHGLGVVVNIKNIEEAQTVYQNQEFDSVIFEEMLKGIEYRIICVDHKFVAAAFRKPAHVVGDGIHTITELIEQKNQHPWRGEGHTHNLSFIKVDELVTEYLSEQNVTLESIIPDGQEVMLRRTANLSTGGEAWDVTDQISAENRAIFEDISRACDLNIIGIDIMCQSLSTPLTDQSQAGVIEVNASPGLRMHHFPIQGQPRNVAQVILKMTIDTLK